MANSDKNIVITPNRSNTAEPKIVFTGGNNNPTTVRVLDDGTISFEGGAGQLFSVSNTNTGNVIFGVNDISGFPIIETYANAQIQLSRVSPSRVSIGTNTTPSVNSLLTLSSTSTVSAIEIQGPAGSNNGWLKTPSGVRFGHNSINELVLLNLGQLRFTDATASWNYDQWGGIKYTTANSTLMIGGPGAPGFTNNTVVSANIVMHNATTGNFMVANASATNLFVGANGNIGIGNTAPTYKLIVDGAGASVSQYIRTSSGYAELYLFGSTANYLTTNQDLIFYSGSERMRFASNGNFGIANASPATALSVGGAIAYTGTAYQTPTALTDGATISWTTTSAQIATVTLGGNRTMAAPTGLINGAFYSLEVIQDATGSRTLAWNSVFKWTGGIAPVLSTAANARDYFVFRSNGTNLYEQGRSLGVA